MTLTFELPEPDAYGAIPLIRKPSKPRWGDFDFSRTTKMRRPPENRNPIFEGWDTETVSKDALNQGKAFLLCNSNQAHPIGSNGDFLSALRFMVKNGQSSSVTTVGGLKIVARRINSFWHIDFDVAAIFKWNLEALQSLYPESGAEGEWTHVDNGVSYKVRYLRKKKLEISIGPDAPEGVKVHRVSAKFFDANLFYNQSLAKASVRYLNEEPPEIKAHRGENLYARWNDTAKGRLEVESYCQWDARSASRLMKLFFEKCWLMNFYPATPISCGYVAQDFLLTRSGFPHVFDTPSHINGAFWEAFRGGWIDQYKRGTMDAWKYDINGAYPWAMDSLPDLRDGEWLNQYIPDASLGVIDTIIQAERDSVAAVSSWMNLGSSTTNGYPWLDVPVRTWITLPEYQALGKCPGVSLKTANAWSFMANPDARKPYHRAIMELQEFKNHWRPKRQPDGTWIGDEAAYLASKQVTNSCYGKTCQRIPIRNIEGGISWKPGKLFNPVYAASITGKTRGLIIDAMRNNMPSIVSVATDCLTSTKPLKLPIHDFELGKWKIEAEGENGLFVFPGIYEIGTHAAAQRGFRLTTCICGHVSKAHPLGACLDCGPIACPKFKPSLARMVDTAGETLSISFERPWGVREAYRAKDLDLVGVFEGRTYKKKLDNPRRFWNTEPKTFHDLLTNSYSSNPIPFSLLAAMSGGKSS